MKLLINLSNYPSAKWEQKQKDGFDKIVDIYFPEVTKETSLDEIYKIADKIIDDVKLKVSNLNTEDYAWICIQGDICLSYTILLDMNNLLPIVVPCNVKAKYIDKFGRSYHKIIFDHWRFLK